MRKGDIIVNPWVSRCFNGKLNPNYATIYLGNNESLAYTGKVCGWADKVYKDNPDRHTPWKVIGHIDLDTIIETAIREAVKTEPHIVGKHADVIIIDESQTDIEIARAIVHKAIDDAAIAEDAYPHLRQKMHDAVDNYDPQTERSK